MKKKLSHLLMCMMTSVLLLVSLVSCEKKDAFFSKPSEHLDEMEIVLLRERNPDFPWEADMFENNPRKLQSMGSELQPMSPQDFVGYSWLLNYFPIDRSGNAGIKVIDINSCIDDSMVSAHIDDYKHTDSYSYTFSDYKRLTTQSNYYGAFSMGSKFSLCGIEAGAKAQFDMTFSTKTETESKNVFGYFEYRYDGIRYKVIFPDFKAKKRYIAAKYISDEFRWALSNFTPQTFVNKFGAYLLCDYVTGGKSSVLYLGNMKSETTADSSEMNLKIAMSASLANVDTAGVSFDYSQEDYVNAMSTFNSIEVSSSSVGGAPNNNSATVTTIDQFKVDYSGWAESLSDYSKHTIIKINEGGLIPLSDFVLEENLKKMFEDIYAQDKVEATSFIEPFIEVEKNKTGVSLSGFSDKWTVKFTLTTRYGDKLKLATLNNVSIDEANRFLDEKYDEFKQLFGTRIVYKASNSMLMSNGMTGPSLQIKEEYIFWGKEYMSKYMTPSGITYLIYDDPSENNVYIYTVYDEFVEYAYGLRDYIESLPEKDFDILSAVNNDEYVFNAL